VTSWPLLIAGLEPTSQQWWPLHPPHCAQTQRNPRAALRPPAPRPLRRPPDLFTFFKAARENPLASWTEEHFEKPILAAQGVLGRVTVLSDPAAIRHVLVENASNYRKDDLQRRVLAPGLANGLLTAEVRNGGPSAVRLRRSSRPVTSPASHAPWTRPRSGSCAGSPAAARDGRSTSPSR
jgi:hypothetical protein